MQTISIADLLLDGVKALTVRRRANQCTTTVPFHKIFMHTQMSYTKGTF